MLSMGRGRRILKWLGRRLLSQNTKAKRYRKETDTSQDSISGSFSDVSLTNYLPAEPPQPGKSRGSFSDIDALGTTDLDAIGCGQYCPDHTTLSPILEVHEEIANPFNAKPVLDITTSKTGNVAFEVSFSKEATAQAVTIPKRFSSMGSRNQSHARLEERMKKIAKNRKTHLQLRCESLKERRLMATNVRRRKMASAMKPPLLGSFPFKDSAIPDAPVGVAFEMAMDVYRPRSAKSSWQLKMERAMDKSNEVVSTSSGPRVRSALAKKAKEDKIDAIIGCDVDKDSDAAGAEESETAMVEDERESSSDDDSEFDFSRFYKPDLAHGEGSSHDFSKDALDKTSSPGKAKVAGMKKKRISFSNEVEVFQEHRSETKSPAQWSPSSTSSLKSCLVAKPNERGIDQGVSGKRVAAEKTFEISVVPEEGTSKKLDSVRLSTVSEESVYQQKTLEASEQKLPDKCPSLGLFPDRNRQHGLPAKGSLVSRRNARSGTNVFPVEHSVEQAMKKWQEKQLLTSNGKRNEEKVETEKRWQKVHAENERLWRQEQRRNEKKWRARLMKNEVLWQEEQARWEAYERREWQELRWEKTKLQEELVEKEKESAGSHSSSLSSLPKLPVRTCTALDSPGVTNNHSSSAMGTHQGCSFSCPRQYWQRKMQSPESNHDMSCLSKVAQSTGQLSKTDISTSSAGGHAKMPSIDSSRSGRLLASLDQNRTDDQPTMPANRKLNSLIETGGFRQNDTREITKKDFFLPPLVNTPISHQALNLNDPLRRTTHATEFPRGRPKFSLPQKNDNRCKEPWL